MVDEPPGFVEFWALWPRKVARRSALVAWQKMQCEPLAGAICAAVVRQRAQWRDPRYIPYPATWLRGARWEDEPPVAAPAPPPRPAPPPPPQQDRWRAALNRALLHVALTRRGIPPAALPALLRARDQCAATWRAAWGEGEPPAEDDYGGQMALMLARFGDLIAAYRDGAPGELARR
jgi:hypothetical protein